MSQLKCCETTCGAPAEWDIYYAPFGFEDNSHSCTQHVGTLLSDGEHRIFPLLAEAPVGTASTQTI